jgi:succinate dehydrogenase / fumarate reductase membrane anchor subunit
MSGFPAWLIQRLSAVYMAFFIVAVLVWLLAANVDYPLWHGAFQTVWVKLAVLLFGLSLLFHAWVGLRDVIVDYIHPLGLKVLKLSLLALFLLANGFWLLSILWGSPL